MKKFRLFIAAIILGISSLVAQPPPHSNGGGNGWGTGNGNSWGHGGWNCGVPIDDMTIFWIALVSLSIIFGAITIYQNKNKVN